ncbi:MAG: response regulator [Bdellovibrionaceae bacterium]|nr:response regulator [Pseudobdellovibrionaceae bacterium]
MNLAASRLALLAEISADLSRAASTKEVVRILIGPVASAIGATATTVMRMSSDRTHLDLIESTATDIYGPGLVAFIPLSLQVPLAASARDARRVLIRSRTDAEAEFPLILPMLETCGSRTVINYPLLIDGHVTGAFAYGIPKDDALAAEDLAFLDCLSVSVAHALDRVYRRERDRDARRLPEDGYQWWFEYFEQAPANIAIVKGPDFKYVYANESFLATSPHGRDLIGKTLQEAHPGLEGQKGMLVTKSVYDTGQMFVARELEVLIRYHDGRQESRYYTGTLIPWMVDGQVEGIINVNFDVTEHVTARRVAEMNQMRLNCALDAGQLGLWEWHAATNTTWRSEWHRRIFGDSVSDQDWSVEKFVSYFHPEDRPRAQREVEEAVARGGPFAFETRIIRGDGEIRWIMDSGEVFYKNGRPTHATGVVYDITHLKETERQLLEAKERAEAADRAKTEFVANMSHELRTPLTAILGFAELLGQSDLRADRRASYLDGVRRNSQVLVKLIEDLLDLSKVEAGHMDIDLHRVPLRDLLNDTLALFQDSAKKAQVELRASVSESVPRIIVTDPVRLKQILANIVGNAVKFTEPGGTITVSVDPSMRSACAENEIVIHVIDTGVGIDPADASKLFKAFSQIENGRRRPASGTGLGLFISRRLAQALGGDVRLKASRLGQGSHFEIRIIDAADSFSVVGGTGAGEAEESVRLDHVRLLLAEDTDDVRLLMRDGLREAGAIVESAVDGREALERARRDRFDAIIMDIRMPEMDGLEATRRLRGEGLRVPIIGVSAHAEAHDHTEALEAGCDVYLTKPVRLPELTAAVARLLRGR